MAQVPPGTEQVGRTAKIVISVTRVGHLVGALEPRGVKWKRLGISVLVLSFIVRACPNRAFVNSTANSERADPPLPPPVTSLNDLHVAAKKPSNQRTWSPPLSSSKTENGFLNLVRLTIPCDLRHGHGASAGGGARQPEMSQSGVRGQKRVNVIVPGARGARLVVFQGSACVDNEQAWIRPPERMSSRASAGETRTQFIMIHLLPY